MKNGDASLFFGILLLIVCSIIVILILTKGKNFSENLDLKIEAKSTTNVCLNSVNFNIKDFDCSGKITLENAGQVQLKKIILKFYSTREGLLDTQSVENLDIFQIKEFILNKEIPKKATKIEAMAFIENNGEEVSCPEVLKQKVISC